MPDSQSQQIGRLALDRGFITATQLREALEEQQRRAASGEKTDMGHLLLELGSITVEQLKTLGGTPPERKRGVKKRIGNFELLESLGRGGMGAVYLARQVSMDRLVALKILKPVLAEDHDFVTRFLREGRLAGQLDHPNLVRAIDVGELGKSYYLAMEFIDGPSLFDVLKEKQLLPEKQALRYTLDVARALSCADKHGIIHRDIKPANILIDKQGLAKLTDLGLAKQVGGETQLTQTGVTMGSPDYVSPEQAGGEREVDIRGDIYSLGITLFHLVTGRTPFTGPSAIAVMTKHLTEKVPWAQDLNADVSSNTALVIARMTARKPDDRYKGPAELVADLKDVLDGGPPSIAMSAGAAATSPTTPKGPPVSGGPPPSPAPPTATPLPDKPTETRKTRYKRWAINCLAILGGIFLLLMLVGMCAGNRRDKTTAKANQAPAIAAAISADTKPTTETDQALDIAAAIPADAMLAVVGAPANRWMRARNETALGAVWKEPSAHAFLAPQLEKAMRRWQSWKQQLEGDTQGTLVVDDFGALLEDEMALALLNFTPASSSEGGDKPVKTQGEPVLLLVARIGSKRPDIERALKAIAARLEAHKHAGRINSAVIKHDASAAHEVQVLEVNNDAVAAWAFARGCFLFSFDRDAVGTGLRCLDKKKPSLAGSGGGEPPEDLLLSATINVTTLLKHWRRTDPNSDGRRNLVALGFAGIERINYRLACHPPRFFEEVHLDVRRPQGLLKLLATSRPLKRSALRLVPADSTGALIANLHSAGIMEVVEEVAAGTRSATADGLSSTLRDFKRGAKSFGLDVDALLEDGLSGEVALVLGRQHPGQKFPPLSLVLGLRDRGQARDLIGALGKLALYGKHEAEATRRLRTAGKWGVNAAENKRQLQVELKRHGPEIVKYQCKSRTYKSLELFALPHSESNPLRLTALLGQDHLVLATSAKAAKRTASVVVKPGNTTLAANEGARETWRHLAGKRFAFLYVNTPQAIRTLGPLLVANYQKKRAMAPSLPKPPELEAVAKHLGPAAASLYAEPGALRLEMISNVPRGLPLLWAIMEEEATPKRGAPTTAIAK